MMEIDQDPSWPQVKVLDDLVKSFPELDIR